VTGTQSESCLGPELIEGAIRNLGIWAPVAYVVLFALGTVLFVPGALFGLSGGVLFGPFWGTAFNLFRHHVRGHGGFPDGALPSSGLGSEIRR
jgi:uncharacterized membrane protein YdjX (TVP38/TMEM64 family)